MKGFGLYLIILVCLLAGVSYVVSQTQQTETLSYNQIYNYFMDGDVDQYDVDDTTLTMHLKKENRTYTYDLGDYRSVFYNDLGETIQQQMRDGTLTKVDYRTATIPWWAQFLPYVILIVLLIAFWYFMMNKQSGGGAGPMQFGKARAKLAQDDKRKGTVLDVAGAGQGQPPHHAAPALHLSPGVPLVRHIPSPLFGHLPPRGAPAMPAACALRGLWYQ